MNEFSSALLELESLLKDMEKYTGSAEAQILERIPRLLLHLNDKDIRALNNEVAGLRQFWLNSVPWCSVLSKGIEKALICFEEEFK